MKAFKKRAFPSSLTPSALSSPGLSSSVASSALGFPSTRGRSREFAAFVSALFACESKIDQDVLIIKHSSLTRRQLTQRLTEKQGREILLKLLFFEMLGHPAAFGYMKALEMTASTNLLVKRTAYLCCALLLPPEHELRFMLVNQLQRDLQSSSYLEAAAAVEAAARVVGPEMIPAVLPCVSPLLQHEEPMVRRKTFMCLLRFFQLDASTITDDIKSQIQHAAMYDDSPQVQQASLCVVRAMIEANPESYREGFVQGYVHMLEQAVKGRLPQTADFHYVPAPWLQLQLLKVLSQLLSVNPEVSVTCAPVLEMILDRCVGSNAMENAVAFQCIQTLTVRAPVGRRPPAFPTSLLRSAAETVSRFVRSPENNMRYIGVRALAAFVQCFPEHKFEQADQLAVVSCLEDADPSIQQTAIELLYAMCSPSNVVFIVQRLLRFLSSGKAEEFARAGLVARVAQLLTTYSPDRRFFLEQSIRLCLLGRDLLKEEFRQTMINVIGERTLADEEWSERRRMRKEAQGLGERQREGHREGESSQEAQTGSSGLVGEGADEGENEEGEQGEKERGLEKQKEKDKAAAAAAADHRREDVADAASPQSDLLEFSPISEPIALGQAEADEEGNDEADDKESHDPLDNPQQLSTVTSRNASEASQGEAFLGDTVESARERDLTTTPSLVTGQVRENFVALDTPINGLEEHSIRKVSQSGGTEVEQGAGSSLQTSAEMESATVAGGTDTSAGGPEHAVDERSLDRAENREPSPRCNNRCEEASKGSQSAELQRCVPESREGAAVDAQKRSGSSIVGSEAFSVDTEGTMHVSPGQSPRSDAEKHLPAEATASERSSLASVGGEEEEEEEELEEEGAEEEEQQEEDGYESPSDSDSSWALGEEREALLFHREVVQTVVELFDVPRLPPLLRQTLAWVMGELGDLVGSAMDEEEVAERLSELLEQSCVSGEDPQEEISRLYLVTALTKITIRLGRPLDSVERAIERCRESRSTTLQQHCLEHRALVRHILSDRHGADPARTRHTFHSGDDRASSPGQKLQDDDERNAAPHAGGFGVREDWMVPAAGEDEREGEGEGEGEREGATELKLDNNHSAWGEDAAGAEAEGIDETLSFLDAAVERARRAGARSYSPPRRRRRRGWGRGSGSESEDSVSGGDGQQRLSDSDDEDAATADRIRRSRERRGSSSSGSRVSEQGQGRGRHSEDVEQGRASSLRLEAYAEPNVGAAALGSTGAMSLAAAYRMGRSYSLSKPRTGAARLFPGLNVRRASFRAFLPGQAPTRHSFSGDLRPTVSASTSSSTLTRLKTGSGSGVRAIGGAGRVSDVSSRGDLTRAGLPPSHPPSLRQKGPWGGSGLRPGIAEGSMRTMHARGTQGSALAPAPRQRHVEASQGHSGSGSAALRRTSAERLATARPKRSNLIMGSFFKSKRAQG